MTAVYRLATGTLTKAALQANAAYIVANFTRTHPYENWAVGTSGLIQPGSRRAVSLSGVVTAYGNYSLPAWSLLITKTQTDYLDTNIFAGLQSTTVTIQTFDGWRDAWRCFNCVMVQPDLSAESEIFVNNHWFNRATFTFNNATEAAAS